MSTREIGGRGIRLVLAALLVAAVFATGAGAAESPLVTVGANPGGSQAATGSAAQSGQTDACLNGQRSAVSPNNGNPVQINTGACATNSAQAGGSGSSSGSQGSGSAGGTGASGSRTSGSRTTGSTRGLRIARVQFFTHGVGVTKRFRVLVTVRNLGGLRVGNAIVSIGSLAGARHTVGGTSSTFTDRLGQAGLVLTATKPMLGQRVLLRIAARTPGARATTVGSVVLPKHFAR